jgi:carboxyl-terminal processing protease
MPRARRNPVPVLGALVVVALVAGIWLGGHPDRLPGFARDTLVGDQQGRHYQDALDVIERDYYRPVNRDKLLDTSIAAAVRSLDDQFSNYFSPRAYDGFQESTRGQFDGVGMTVEEVSRGLRVLTVYRDSPAQRGGLEPGDLITKVDGRSLAGKSSEASTALIRGRAGTSVTLTLRTDGGTRTVRLRRSQVDIPVVQSGMRRAEGEKIGWVHLSSFTTGAHGEVSSAVHKLLRRGADGMVLDLRDNGGGLLNEAVLVASVFLPDGRVVSTKGRNRPEEVSYAKLDETLPDFPMAVLVNEHSASAAEMVAAFASEYELATLVGTTTAGRLVATSAFKVGFGYRVVMPVATYFTWHGTNLEGRGLAPTVEEPFSFEASIQGRDNQLERATQFLRNSERSVAVGASA